MKQAKRKTGTSRIPGHLNRMLREGALVLLIAMAFCLLLALLTYHPLDPGFTRTGAIQVRNMIGTFGAWFADLSLWLFGYMALLLPVILGYCGWLVLHERTDSGELDRRKFYLRTLGFILLVLSGCGLGSFISAAPGTLPEAGGAGGVFGNLIGVQGLFSVLGDTGAKIMLLAIFIASFTLATGISWFTIMDLLGGYTLGLSRFTRGITAYIVDLVHSRRARTTRKETFEVQQRKKETRKPPRIEPVIRAVEPSEREFKERQITLFEVPSSEELPPLSLLDDKRPQQGGYSGEALEAMSRLVEHKLKDFGVEVEVVAVHPGPVITRFELQPAPGVKVNQITNLSKDIARSLSVISVRVVEVIPGKSVVGLEIPNEQRELVVLSEILKSKQYDSIGTPLALALGKDISGRPVVADLSRMPHLLVAGTTGSGKSVAINAMLLSLLYKASPQDVRMILVDPKMLELNVYEGIPHLLTPVVTDMKDAANALRWCVGEMERRYKIMSTMGVRNIIGYNRKIQEAEEKKTPIPDPLYKRETAFDPEAPAPMLKHMPYIVVIIDEFADMIMVVGKKVEELIARLAQKARAAGVHLILATQRPSVDVITGLIKANIPSRIAFQVSAKVDSRTILDQMGAEQLLGHGDMLYLPPGVGIPERVHGAFVDDHEVHKVVAYLKKAGKPEYIEGLLEENHTLIPGLGAGNGAGDEGERDPLYDEAVAVVTETRKASISYVQRRLKVGYNRAARMLEEMENAGVVSNVQANGSREVLAPPPPE